MAKTEFIPMLREQGLVDERNAGVIAICDSPSGYGMGLACVKGGTLRIYETWYHGKPGALTDEIELKEIRDMKCSAFILHSYLKFRYRGARYLLKNFGGAKDLSGCDSGRGAKGRRALRRYAPLYFPPRHGILQ